MDTYNSKYGTTYHQGLLRKRLVTPLAILVAINIAVFVIIGIVQLASSFTLSRILLLPAPISSFLYQPWGLLTYMFVQADFINLLFNMLWLCAFGIILQRMGDKRLFVFSYIAGGIAGGILFVFSATIAHYSLCYLIGASASVMGVITACAVLYPRLELNLFLFGNIQLRWVAIVALLLCGLAPALGNIPTLVAHAGGVCGGLAVALLRPTTKSPAIKVKSRNIRQQERRGLTDKEQYELDKLLDRVRISGYKSLNMKERSRLFNLSNKIKD